MITRMKTILTSLVALLILMASSVSPAHATLSAVGPIDPGTHFPAWYQDSNGLRLGLCLDGPPNCAATPADLVAPDGEAFYELAQANAGPALLTLALEAAYSGPGTGQEITFSRIRFVARTGLQTNATYKVTHPYGTDTFTSDARGAVPANRGTEDIGCAVTPTASCNFLDATFSRLGPFLAWDTLGQPPAAGGPPAGFVGDAATPHKVIGSPTGNNLFRIEGPRINPNDKVDACPTVAGLFADCIETNLFTVEGKIAGLQVSATPGGGTYNAPQSVSLTASNPAATIYYTLDGTDPTPASLVYSGPINISATTTLKYMAVDAAGNASAVATATYVINVAGHTALSLAASPASVTYGQATNLSGKLLNSSGAGLGGKTVILEQRPASVLSFSRVGSVITAADGSYSLAVNPAKNTDYRASFAGVAGVSQASTSGIVRVNVRVQVSMNLSVTNVPLGQSVTISGAVTPANPGNLSLRILRPDGRTDNIGVGLVNNSTYSFVYKPSFVGSYTVQAVYTPKDTINYLGNSSASAGFSVVR